VKLYRTTKSLVLAEKEEAAMDLMEKKAEIIDVREAYILIGEEEFRQLIDQSCWDTPLEYLADWSLCASTSTIHNKPCVIVYTTETDFIFTSEEDAVALHRKFNASHDSQEWQRCQRFGPDGLVPERPHFNNRIKETKRAKGN